MIALYIGSAILLYTFVGVIFYNMQLRVLWMNDWAGGDEDFLIPMGAILWPLLVLSYLTAAGFRVLNKTVVWFLDLLTNTKENP